MAVQAPPGPVGPDAEQRPVLRRRQSGPCPGRQTIGGAELAAVAHVLREADAGVVVTDCLGTKRKCQAIQAGRIPKEWVFRGVNADLWAEVWGILRSNRSWKFEWMASHKSEGEALAAGVPLEAWVGNVKADEAAKAQARLMDIEPHLLEKWAENQRAVEAVWRLIAESQVAHLAGRLRRQDGAAVKSRKRRAPHRPSRSTRPRTAAMQPAEPQPTPGAQHEAGGRPHCTDGLD